MSGRPGAAPADGGSERRWQRLAIAAGLAALVVAWVVSLRTSGTSPAGATQRLVDVLRGSAWAAPAYVAAYALRPLVLFPASLLTIAGGLLFGPVWGIVLTVVAANLSAMVAYGLGRLLGRPPAGEEAEAAGLAARWAGRLRQRSFATVLVMRLALLPFDLVNYLCGYLRIAPLSFLTATALGSLPATVAFVLAGAAVDRVDAGLGGLDGRVFAASAAIFVASLAVARVLHRGDEAGPA
jgi:uncharacterized membrane protein YdjX (TVP38/TMEM64 family)